MACAVRELPAGEDLSLAEIHKCIWAHVEQEEFDKGSNSKN
jgi:hypothetical protein